MLNENTRNLGVVIGLAMLVTPQLACAEGAFSGLYGGIGAAYGFNGTSVSSDGTPSVFDFDIKGSNISLLGGFNFQSGRFVFGVEGDASFGSIKDSQSVTENGIRYDGSVEGKTVYSLRARLGFTPSENLLLYGTAGPAWTKLSAKTILVSPALLGPQSPYTYIDQEKSVTGYALGVGGEYNLGETTTLRLEYSELFYNKVAFEQRNPFFGGAISTITTDNAVSYLRTVVAYRF